MRCDSIAFTSVEVQNLHAEAGTFNDPVDQCLKTNFINFSLQRVYLRGAILLQWQRQESLVSMRIKSHPRARQKLDSS